MIRRIVGRLVRFVVWVVVLLVIGGALFHFVYRPWNLRWGATDEEVARTMPGDDICQDATFNATRAITIDAPPEAVWPWIVQMGYQRAGFYSYDFLDNAGTPSAQRIVPELQDLKLGDRVPLDRRGGVIVRALEPNRFLLLATKSKFLTWTWDLREAGAGRTRLVSRVRALITQPQPKFIWEAFEIFMMRRCLLGIKRRAESMADRASALPTSGADR